jgi:hypothetical protein
MTTVANRRITLVTERLQVIAILQQLGDTLMNSGDDIPVQN